MLTGLVADGRPPGGAVGVTVALAQRTRGEVPRATLLPALVAGFPHPLVLQVVTCQYDQDKMPVTPTRSTCNSMALVTVTVPVPAYEPSSE